MKNLLFLLLILITLPYSFARDIEFESMLRGQFRSYDDVLKVTNQIINKTVLIAEKNGIEVRIENLTTSTGNISTYPALRIVPSNRSRANLEALEIDKKYGGLKLYLSPYDLKRSGANAFFNPNGSVIGVPAEFLYNNISESYQHEKMHATTYLKLITGQDDTYAGVFKLIKGERMSERNFEGYTRFSSLDEFLATAFSAKENCQSLYAIYKKSTPSEFMSRRDNEELLSQVLFNTKIGIGLSAQTHHLIQQTLSAVEMSKYKIEKYKIALGVRLEKEVYAYKVLVDATERVFHAGRGNQVPVPNGTEITLYALNSDPKKLAARLNSIMERALILELRAKEVQKHIGVRIEYADLPKTNMESLSRACETI